MKFLSFLFLFGIAFQIQSQIPNPGFENWSPNQACLRPDEWNSVFSEFDSSGTYCPVQRSEDHFPSDLGQYSVRIANDTALWHSGTEPASWLGWGILFSSHFNDRPLFPVEGRPKSFCGYYRFLPENGDTLNFRAFLYNNGNEIAMAHFRTDQPAPEWTPFQIFFNDTNYVQVDSGRITLSSANEPKDGSLGPLGNSVVWVDNIGFDKLLTEIRKPIRNKITAAISQDDSRSLRLERSLFYAGKTAEIKLLDLQGRQVFRQIWPSGEQKLELNLTTMKQAAFIFCYDDDFLLESQLIPCGW